MKGFLGLSGAILIQIYQTVLNNKPSSCLLLLALLPSINPLLLMRFVRIHNVSEREDKKQLDIFSVIALLVAAYLMIIIILERVFNFQFMLRVIAFVLLLVLLVSPIFVAIRAQETDSDVFSATERNELLDEPKIIGRHYCTGYQNLPRGSEGDSRIHENNSLHSIEDLDLLKAVSTVDFWILFLAMACGMGSGLATVNNISQVGESLGYASNELTPWFHCGAFGTFLGDSELVTYRIISYALEGVQGHYSWS